MMIGLIPAELHKTSQDVLRYALENTMFICLGTLLYLRLFYSYLSSSNQTGAPYSKSVRIAPF